MSFIDHDAGVLGQHEVRLYLFQQNTIRHELDLGLLRNMLIIESNLVADCGAALFTQLFGNSLRQRDSSYTSWLCDTDEAFGAILKFPGT
jgi:hypothetical protein